MIKEPLFKSTPTMRTYEKYKWADAYTQGWNEAMRFIFAKEIIEERRKNMKLVKK